MTQATFSDQVHVGHGYYIAFGNQIFVGYDYFLDQVYYFDKVSSDLVYHREDPNKMKEVSTPWDPGKSALHYPSKTSAWGQADFQEGRNVMTLACVHQVGPLSWVIDGGLGPYDPPGARAATYKQHEATSKPSSWITNRMAAPISLPCIPLPPTFGSLSL